MILRHLLGSATTSSALGKEVLKNSLGERKLFHVMDKSFITYLLTLWNFMKNPFLQEIQLLLGGK